MPLPLGQPGMSQSPHLYMPCDLLHTLRGVPRHCPTLFYAL